MSSQPATLLTRPVEAQLAAYNARNIDGFVAAYAENIRLLRFPQEVYCEGHAALRDRYGPLFRLNPGLHAKLLRRTILPPYVIDHELVTGLATRGPIEALAIYEVRGDLIQSVSFIQKDC